MLSKEVNDLLTQVGPGTPCGDLMRRYWQPAALAEELPPNGAPLPVRLLGEDLVLFRDGMGRPGLLAIHCSHRGADLSYGRVEDGGIRCIYHGWLYDADGRCLEQPGEPAGSTFHERIRHPAYPCVEMGGLILAYLGPGPPPAPPGFEFLRAPEEYRYATKMFHDCNYLQANEGNVDPQHSSFLHRVARRDRASMAYLAGDGAPTVDWEEMGFGLRVYSVRRIAEDRTYVRLTYLILPNLSAFGGMWGDGYQVNWHVPIDDAHHWKYALHFSRTSPLDKDGIRGSGFDLTPDYYPRRNSGNRYLQDRESMQDGFYSGLGADFYDHDLWATETQGAIVDRTVEHTGYTDRAVVAGRNVLLKAIAQVQRGEDPPMVDRATDDPPLVNILVEADVLASSVDRHAEYASRHVMAKSRSWAI
jgi:phthalate 4,5-dioxygenase oxygenase subunit